MIDHTFRFSKEQGQKPIILKNLTTIAKLVFLLNVANDYF